MENDFLPVIESAGLSPAEAKLYGALLEIHEGTMTDLAKRAGMKRSSGYNSIGRLEQLGLVSQIARGKRKHYSAVHPQRLLQIANLRQRQIEESLPQMVGAYYGEGEKPKVQMFEGINAVRETYRDALQRLKKKEELCIFTNIGRVTELFPEVLVEFQKTIGAIMFKSKIKELVCGDKAGLEYAKSLQDKLGMSYELRLSKNNTLFGDNEQFIFKDKIIYFSLKKNIFVIVIENEDLATTHKSMFDMAWENALQIGEPGGE